jgi:hypothetical protein
LLHRSIRHTQLLLLVPILRLLWWVLCVCCASSLAVRWLLLAVLLLLRWHLLAVLQLLLVLVEQGRALRTSDRRGWRPSSPSPSPTTPSPTTTSGRRP